MYELRGLELSNSGAQPVFTWYQIKKAHSGELFFVRFEILENQPQSCIAVIIWFFPHAQHWVELFLNLGELDAPEGLLGPVYWAAFIALNSMPVQARYWVWWFDWLISWLVDWLIGQLSPWLSNECLAFGMESSLWVVRYSCQFQTGLPDLKRAGCSIGSVIGLIFFVCWPFSRSWFWPCDVKAQSFHFQIDRSLGAKPQTVQTHGKAKQQ